LTLILNAAIDQSQLAEDGSLFRYDEPSQRLIIQRKSGGHPFVQYSEFRVGEGVAGIVAATRIPVLINDCANDDRYIPFTVRPEQLRSILGVPVVSPDNHLLGILCIHNSTSAQGFTERDKWFLDQLANIAGGAWANALAHSAVIEATHTDPVTGLLNRTGMDQVLRQDVGKASLSGRPLSVLYIDLDNLKQLNDTYNSEVGDRAILATASAIKEITGLEWRNKAGKWMYGDEFLVVLPGAFVQRATEVAEQICRLVAERNIGDQTLGRVACTVSIGVAELQAGVVAGQLVGFAEEAKMRAKKAGRNRVSI
jgi:diguanylate cyclase (GGDEF)-like protein